MNNYISNNSPSIQNKIIFYAIILLLIVFVLMSLSVSIKVTYGDYEKIIYSNMEHDNNELHDDNTHNDNAHNVKNSEVKNNFINIVNTVNKAMYSLTSPVKNKVEDFENQYYN